MKKLMMKYVFLLLFLTCIFSSCRNEKKEKYLQEVEKVLIANIHWMLVEVSDNGQRIQAVYMQEGKPDSFTPLVDSVKRVLDGITRLQKETLSNNGSESIHESIGKKNKLLKQLIDADSVLDQILDKVWGIEFDRYYKNREVAVNLKKQILMPGDSLTGKIFLVARPDKYPPGTYQAFLNGSSVDAVDGKVYVTIPGDSTSKMLPGNHRWNGAVKINYGGKDSVFTIFENVLIKPSICEN